MRIPNNSISQTLVSQLQTLTSQQSRLQSQAATGQRITNASDDPAAMGRVLDLQSEKQQIQQFGKNTDRALALTQTSFSAVSQLKKLSDRAGELAILGSGVSGPQAASAYGTETNQVLEETLKVANSSYNGEHIFAGTKTDVPPYSATRDASGNITAITYNGAAAGAAFNTSEGAAISPFTTGTDNQNFADFANNLVSLRDSLNTNNNTGVQAAQVGLQTTEDRLLSTVSNIGAIQSRFETDSVQNASRYAQLDKLTSASADSDLSETIVKLTQAKTSYQAALQSGAKFLELSLMDYVR